MAEPLCALASADLGWSLLPTAYSSCVTLEKAPNFSEPQYPDLENGATLSDQAFCEDFHETALCLAQAAPT